MMPETQNVAWNRSWRDDCLAWICGFANARGGVLCLRFPFSEAYLAAAGSGCGSTDQGTTPKTSPKTSPKASPKTSPQATRSTEPMTAEARILAMLRTESGISQPVIAERLGMSVRAVKYHFRKLREAGAIRRVGSSRAGHWEVL